MKFSLILCTLGRSEEVDAVLASFKSQTYTKFEVILVDQNEKRFLDPILKKYKTLNITYIHSKQKGLSQARNKGIKKATGNVISFPDDDCEYQKDTLEKVKQYFENNTSLSMIDVRIEDKNTKRVSAGSKKEYEFNITVLTFNEACSAGLFIKHDVVKQIGLYDEKMGVGAQYPAGEESDYVLRALYKKHSLVFTPDIIINHPEHPDDDMGIYTQGNKSYHYGRGWGYLFRKHIFALKKPLAVVLFVKHLVGALGLSSIYLLTFNSFKRKKYWNIFCGMVVGFVR